MPNMPSMPGSGTAVPPEVDEVEPPEVDEVEVVEPPEVEDVDDVEVLEWPQPL